MKDWIELLKAVAWPISAFGIVIVAYAALRLVLSKLKDPKIAVGHKESSFSLEGKSILAPTKSNLPDAAQIESHIQANAEASTTLIGTEGDTIKAVGDQKEGEDEFFYVAKDKEKIKQLFEKFRTTEDYKTSTDLWESVYLIRREQVGVRVEDSEYKKLGEENGSWAWPYIVLARRCITRSEYDDAAKYLEIAKARQTDASVEYVSIERVRIAYRTGGNEGALEEVRKILNEVESSAAKVASIKQLRIETDAEKVIFPQSLFDEYAHRLDESNLTSRFGLAYLYIDDAEFSHLSITEFDDLVDDGYAEGGSLNNLGVLAGRLNEDQLKIDYYERAAEKGNAMALTNLAELLVDAGFVKRAEAVLESIVDADDALAAQAAAASKVTRARKDLQAKQEEILKRAKASARSYRKFANKTIAFWKKNGICDYHMAEFSAENTRVKFENGSVQVLHKTAGGELEGSLKRDGIFYTGRIGKLLDYRKVAAAPIDEDEFMLIMWPASMQNESISEYFLKRAAPETSLIQIPSSLEDHSSKNPSQ